MSIARVYTTQKVRKDWTCNKCGAPIKKGVDGRRSFSVGFRGFEQTRCMKPECTPTRSELESSALSSVWAAQDGIDWSSASSIEDLNQMVQDVADACNEVADEYEANEMYEINEVLQERVEILRAAADELENWDESLGDEPGEEDFETSEEYDTAHDEWLETAIDAAQSTVDEVEMP